MVSMKKIYSPPLSNWLSSSERPVVDPIQTLIDPVGLLNISNSAEVSPSVISSLNLYQFIIQSLIFRSYKLMSREIQSQRFL